MCHGVTIRRLTAEDAPTLQGISTEARKRYRNIPELNYVADTPPVAHDRFEAGSGWVAETEIGILGYALMKPVDNQMFLDNISTRPEAQGMGVGSRLMALVLRSATELGFNAVALTTFQAPPWNGPWFRRFGFTPIPASEIGSELAGIIERQAQYLDPRQRETLWRPLSRSNE